MGSDPKGRLLLTTYITLLDLSQERKSYERRDADETSQHENRRDDNLACPRCVFLSIGDPHPSERTRVSWRALRLERTTYNRICSFHKMGIGKINTAISVAIFGPAIPYKIPKSLPQCPLGMVLSQKNCTGWQMKVIANTLARHQTRMTAPTTYRVILKPLDGNIRR